MDFCEVKGGISLWNEVCVRIGVMSWGIVFSLQLKFCEGKGDISLWNEVRMDSCVMSWFTVSVHFSLQLKFHVMNDQLSLWNEVRMNSCVRVVMPLRCLYNSNFMRWMGISLYEMRFGEMMGDVVMPLRCLYNSNFMWWMTNYLYEMRFVRIVVWESSCTVSVSFSL